MRALIAALLVATCQPSEPLSAVPHGRFAPKASADEAHVHCQSRTAQVYAASNNASGAILVYRSCMNELGYFVNR